MTDAQEQHLEDVEDRFCLRLDDKYRAGQAEHGGNVWAKPGMLRQIQNEQTDQVVYLDVLEHQLRNVLAHLRAGRLKAAERDLNALLNGAPD